MMPSNARHMRSGPSTLALVTALFIIWMPLQASAQESEAWFELGTHAQNPPVGAAVLALSPLASGYLYLTDLVYVEIIAGGVGTVNLTDDDVDLESRGDVDVRFGNPYLGVGFFTEGSGRQIDITTGLTVPLASTEGAASYAFAEGMRGGADPWLWAPRRLAPVVGGSIRQRMQGGFILGGELQMAAMSWFGDGEQDAIYVLQTGIVASTSLSEDFDIGTRAQGVVGRSLGNQGQRGFQTAAEIFAELEVGDQTYHARLTVPINNPYGFGFSSDGVWGLHIGMGISFDRFRGIVED